MERGRVVRGAEAGRARRIDAGSWAARQEAQARLERARAEEERLLAAARAEADGVRQAARAEGLQAGRAEATRVLLHARSEAAAALARQSADAVRLALQVAARLLGRELEAHPDAVADVVAAALAQVRAEGALVLRVHPLDATAVRARLAVAARPGAEVHLQEDAGVGRGGCVVEAAGVTYDARLDAQLAALGAVLLEGGA